MKISEKLSSSSPIFSFEFFPPKNSEGFATLYETIARLKSSAPGFVSVTYGAGGTTRSKTVDLVGNIKNAIGFKEINSYIENKETLEEVTNLIVKKTKNFAKRQYTWFENRFDQNLKIYGEDNLSLVVETFKKII